MQFECAFFILVVVGRACAVIAALASLFWPRDLEPHEKSMASIVIAAVAGISSRKVRH
jgi:hypothetical protein